MEITSLYFGLLSVLSVFIFYFLNQKYRVLFLTVLSCAFIATYSYNLLIYVVIYSLFNYYFGIKISESKSKKLLFRIGILINLSQLILLKYASFTFNPLFNILNIDLNVTRLSEIIIPIGISFFTLQGIGYLYNVYMNWEKPEKNFIHFLLYIIFYPRFLSGPVERSNHFLPQLKTAQAFNGHNITEGLRMVLFGFFKKIAIANQLAPLINGAYGNLDSYEGLTLWIVFLIQPLYLYFDFSGYTDIARGFAKTMGIDLLPNFDHPFLSENVSTFWKRFHFSLSSWFNDYVFKRTSFKYRKWGNYASAYAVLITWLLFGIWHGAGWNFMVLGVLQAIAINYEFFTKKWRLKTFSKVPAFIKKWMGRILTYLFYGGSLVFFFSPNLHSVFKYFSKLNDFSGSLTGSLRAEIFILILMFITVFMILEIIQTDFTKIFDKLETYWKNSNYWIFRWILYILIITIVIVFNNDVQQFIYFQF